jgi:hypothetical protein
VVQKPFEGGGGYYATDWQRFGVADIWDMVKYDNFDNHPHHRSWEKMRVLCTNMAHSLRRAAKDLLDRWPPDKSPAAQAFAERMEHIALSFDVASQAAGTNGSTLQGVNSGFLSNHLKIKNLVTQWDNMQRAQNDRVSITKNLSWISVLSPASLLTIKLAYTDDMVFAASNMPGIKNVVDMFGGPDVPTTWKQELNTQAQDSMAGVDRELISARAQLQESPVVTTVGPPPPGGYGGGFGGGGFGGGGGGLPGGSGFTPTPYEYEPTDPYRSPVLDDTVLDGSYPGGGGGGGGGYGGIPGGGGGGGGGLPLVSTPGGMAMAPGAVIGAGRGGAGGARGVGGMMPGMMPMGAAGRGAGGKSGVGKAGFVAPAGGMIGGPQGRRRKDEDEKGWGVAGVPGVSERDPESDEHDPGPGVIGIDR